MYFDYPFVEAFSFALPFQYVPSLIVLPLFTSRHKCNDQRSFVFCKREVQSNGIEVGVVNKGSVTK